MQRVEFAQLSAARQFHRLLEVRDAATLRSCLENALLAVNGSGELLAGVNRDGARLFAVDILARPCSPNGSRRVPAVPCRDEHRINVLAVEQLAEITIEDAVRIALMFVNECLAGLATPSLHISDGDALDVLKLQHRLQVIRATWSDTDDPQRNLLVGRNLTLLTEHAGREYGSQ